MARLVAVLAAVAVAVPSVAVADSAAEPPARPTGLQVSTEAGSLEVSVGWDDTDGATSYLVRWRLAGDGHELSEGVEVEASEATVTVEGSGEWVVRVEACNEAGCGLGAAKRFRVQAADEQTSEQESEPPPTTTAPPPTTTTEPVPEPVSVSVSVTASPAVPRPGQPVTLTAVVSDAPSGAAPSHVWEMDAGGWFPVGWSESFSYMAVGAESWTFRVTVSWESGESATSDPITVQWQAASGLKTEIESASEIPTTTTTVPTTTTTTVPAQSVPARPTGLSITTTAGSLDATVGWDDVDDAASYLVRWRQTGTEHTLNEGVTTQTSSATITVDSYGEWVVRVEACNDAGCGLGSAKRFTTRDSHPKLRFVDAYVAPPQQGETPADPATVILTFDQDLQTTLAPAASQFTVKVFNVEDDSAAGTIAADSVEVKDKRVILTLASAPEFSQYLTLDYTHDDDKPIKRAAKGGDPAPSFTAHTVWVLFATSETETIGAQGQGPQAQGQGMGGGTPVTLVSNTGQHATFSAWPIGSHSYAQGFTTGTNVAGYRLTSVRLPMIVVGTGERPTFRVLICTDSSGAPSTTCIGPLTNPELPDLAVPAAPFDAVFVAPGAGIDLDPGTTYYVVVDSTSPGASTSDINLQTLPIDSEDGGAAGWGIANNVRYRQLPSTDWQTNNDPLRIAINGGIDYDKDNDGLIEIRTAAQLDSIRLDTDGNGVVASGDQTDYSNDFPNPLPRMGCPASGCVGYEIGTGRAGEAAIAINMGVSPWIDSPGWVPIPEFTAVFDGNGNKVINLQRDTANAVSNFGLFDTIGRVGVVRNLGVTEALVRGLTDVGVLAGNNAGLIVASYSSGTVGTATTTVAPERFGGLVGHNMASGRIYASYSTALVRSSSSHAMRSFGGLVGENEGTIVASYAQGDTDNTTPSVPVNGFGGLVGRNYGRIHASYALGGGSILGIDTDIGGLVGGAEEGSSVTASYWDTTTRSTSAGGEGKETTELKSPTGYSGPYAGWNVDLNLDGRGDDVWNFGTSSDYPTLKSPLRLAFGATSCVEELTIRDWTDLHYHRYKWSTGKVRPWNTGCASHYYTFTLTEQAQVRFHAQGRSSANLWLREGDGYGPILAHSSRYGYNSQAARVEEILEPGTYTLETAGAHTLWTGTVTPPPASTQVTLVSNEAQTTDSLVVSSEWDQAQAFTTGTDSRGYSITSVAINFNVVSGGTQPTYSVDIFNANSSGVPTGSSLGTFVRSGALVAGSNTFTSSAGALHLNSGTYALVFDIAAAGGNSGGDVTFRFAGSGNEDAGAASGWSIANNSRRRSFSTASWSTIQTAPLKVSFTGFAGAGTGGALCSREIDRGQSHAQRWAADCFSVSNPGPHAAYYVYTPDTTGFVEVTLTSPDAEEQMYLWEDHRQVREDGSSGHNYAEMTWLARAGRTYVLEVTADAPSAGGRYLLAMHNGDSEPTAPPAECWETVAVEGGGPGARPNGWAFGNNAGNNKFEWPCHSVQRPAAYARYFTFTLSEAREVRMELYGSQAAGADMFLRSGTSVSGSHIAESHFPGIGPVRARLDRQLDAGTYTIEAVASSPGNGGHFDVVIKEPPPRFTPTGCLIDLGNITYVGVHSDRQTEAWGASGCSSYLRSGAHARFYQFELTQTVKLAFALDGGPDSRIYLYRGASFRDSDLIEDDLSFIDRNLAPGTYTIEVTTLYGSGRSDDEYTFAYRRTGPKPPEPEIPTGAPTATFTGTVWQATLTVQAIDDREDYLGCRRPCGAAISGSTYRHRFAYNGRWFEVVTVAVTPSGGFTFQMNGALGAAGWRLHVGNQAFTFSGNAGAMSWGGRGENLGWTAGQQVPLRLEKTS